MDHSMALFRPGPLINAISGDVGGVNFASSRYGPLIRRKATRTNKQTRPQLIRRARFAQAKYFYHQLTPDQREAWRALSKTWTQTNRLGIPQTLSAFQLYLKFQINLIAGPPYPIVEPPYPSTTTPISTLTLDFTVGGPYNITITPGVSAFPAFQLIFAHRPVSSNPRTFYNTYNLIGPRASFDGPRDWQSYIENILGPPALDEQIGIKAYLHDLSFFRSPPAFASTQLHA